MRPPTKLIEYIESQCSGPVSCQAFCDLNNESNLGIAGSKDP